MNAAVERRNSKQQQTANSIGSQHSLHEMGTYLQPGINVFQRKTAVPKWKTSHSFNGTGGTVVANFQVRRREEI
jgi:hypothetical protein